MTQRRAALLTTVGLAVAGVAIPIATTTVAQAAPLAAAPTGAVTDQFIVKFKTSGAQSVGVDRLRGVDPLRSLSTGGVVVKAPKVLGAASANALMAKLKAQPGVASVEPDLIMTAQAADPTDTRYAEQWDLFEPTGGMNVPGAWTTADGAGTTVAVIDTGIVGHTDLNANLLPGYDFISVASAARDGNGRDANPNDQGDWYNAGECGGTTASSSSWHGSHVAGTIAAVTDNANGIAGIAPQAKVVPVRVLGKCGGYTSDIVDAIVWSSGGRVSGVPTNANPADVINMSLGGSGACSSTYQNAINKAVRNGTTVVVAAGNSNSDVANFSPASCNNVISVAASDREGNRAFYSNFGAKIDLTAPGGEVRNETDPAGSRTKPQDGILSTINAGATTQTTEDYKTFMGTSMAAPHVAGLAALVLGEGSRTPAQVETLLKNSVRPLPGTCTGGCGTGLADADKAING